MFIAQLVPGYVSKSKGFDTEREALRWQAEMRSAGTRNGIVYEIEGEAS